MLRKSNTSFAGTSLSGISAFFILYAFNTYSVCAQSIPPVVKNNNCVTCHTTNKTLMGPSWQDISDKYKPDVKGKDIINASIMNGTSGKWGAVPMPANPQLKKEDVEAISKWILQR